METTNAPTTQETQVIDSGLIDNRILIAHAQWVQSELREAKWQLTKGLELRASKLGEMHLKEAMKIVNKILGRSE